MQGSEDLAGQKLKEISRVYREDLQRDEREELISELALELLNILGHSRKNIFSNLELETPTRVKHHLGYDTLQFGAIVGKRETAPPYISLVVDLRYGPPQVPNEPFKIEGALADYILSYDVTSRATYTVFFASQVVVVLGQEYPPSAYPMEYLNDDVVDAIIGDLGPPDEYPEGRGGKFPAGHHPDQTKLTRWLFADSEVSPEYRSQISSEHFELDIDEYSERLYEAYTAESNQQKGDALEDVAEFLFRGLKMLSVRDKNLRTRSGELDLVLEYAGYGDHNLFGYLSRFTVLECKNVGQSVSSKEVGHFEKKLREANVELGILIAWNGISGEDTGDNARRYIDNAEKDGAKIIVLTSDDLYTIMDGKSLYDIIDEKLYALRFDLPA